MGNFWFNFFIVKFWSISVNRGKELVSVVFSMRERIWWNSLGWFFAKRSELTDSLFVLRVSVNCFQLSHKLKYLIFFDFTIPKLEKARKFSEIVKNCTQMRQNRAFSTPQKTLHSDTFTLDSTFHSSGYQSTHLSSSNKKIPLD